MKCPRCTELFVRKQSALSRRDNETAICSSCGTAEALEDSGLLPRWIDKYVESGGLFYKPYWNCESDVWLAQLDKINAKRVSG